MTYSLNSKSKTFLLNCDLVPLEQQYNIDSNNMEQLMLSSDDSQYIETIEISPTYLILEEKINFIREISQDHDIKHILQNNFVDLSLISHILQFHPDLDPTNFFQQIQQKIQEFIAQLPLNQLFTYVLEILFLHIDVPFVQIAKGQILSFFPELFNDFPLLRFFQRVVDFQFQFEQQLQRLLAKIQACKQQISALLETSTIRSSTTSSNQILALQQNTYQYFTSKFIQKAQNQQIDVQVSFQIEKFLIEKKLIQTGQITVFFEEQRKEQVEKYLENINISNLELAILQLSDVFLLEFSEILQIISRFDYYSRERIQTAEDSLNLMIYKFKKEKPSLQQAYLLVVNIEKLVVSRAQLVMAALDKCYTKKYIADPDFYEAASVKMQDLFVQVAMLIFGSQVNKKNLQLSVQVFIDEVKQLEANQELFEKVLIGLKKYGSGLKKDLGQAVVEAVEGCRQ